MNELKSVLDALNHPPMKNAAFVHLPIALGIVALLLALIAALLPRNKTCRAMAMGGYALMAIAAFVTVRTGAAAEDALGTMFTPDVYGLIDSHSEMAEKVWLFGTGCVLLIALSALFKTGLRIIFGWLAVLLGIVTVLWIAVTAHKGGTLVYTYGVGTPKPVTCYELPGVRADGRDHAAEHALAVAEQAATSLAAPIDPKIVFFREHVQPIIAHTCARCHNPAKVAAGKSGKLDQTSLAGLLKGGRSGPAIVVGKPSESLLIKRVRGEESGEDQMPPPPNDRLTDDEIAALEQWIRDGAVWP